MILVELHQRICQLVPVTSSIVTLEVTATFTCIGTTNRISQLETSHHLLLTPILDSDMTTYITSLTIRPPKTFSSKAAV